MSTRIVARDRLIVVVAPDHPWAGRTALPADEILARPWVLREPGSGTRSAFETALSASASTRALTVALELPSNEAVRRWSSSAAAPRWSRNWWSPPTSPPGGWYTCRLTIPPRAFLLLRHKERYRTKASLAFEAMLRNATVS